MINAFIFPGQGSQSVGMLADFGQTPVVRRCFEEASEAVGFDLWAVCQDGPEDELGRTEVTQPALLTASVALWEAWRAAGGGIPDLVAGHSLGEYSALVVAGVLPLGEAVALVRRRGELMQSAVPVGSGSMAAILGLDDDKVIEACESAAQGDVVSAVNFNAPGQVVIAGQADAVERAIAACKAAGARRALPLAVSVPSHCALMRSAADALASEMLRLDFRDAEIPVIQNVVATKVRDGGEIRENLVRQLYMPVRWTESVRFAASLGVRKMVECGPGKVLAGLVKRIDGDISVVNIDQSESLAAHAAAWK